MPGSSGNYCVCTGRATSSRPTIRLRIGLGRVAGPDDGPAYGRTLVGFRSLHPRPRASTTALFWITHLTERRIFEREADPADRHRVFMILSDAAAAVAKWFTARRRVPREAMG
jgi:hypothetical protein